MSDAITFLLGVFLGVTLTLIWMPRRRVGPLGWYANLCQQMEADQKRLSEMQQKVTEAFESGARRIPPKGGSSTAPPREQRAQG